MIPGIVSAPLFASAQGMEATADPARASRSEGGSSGGSLTITTPTTTVTVTGGTPPYTHSWDSGRFGLASATAPTSAATAFQATLAAGAQVNDTFTDTVTDANGVQTKAVCNVFIQNVDLR